MSADLSADFAAMVDPAPPDARRVEPPADPWLRRRMHGFGASEMAIVLAALGRRNAEDLPVYMQKRVALKRVRGLEPQPRVFFEKAGIVAPLKAGKPAAMGTRREPLLVRQWAQKIRRGTAGPDCAMLDAASVVYVEGDWPREVLPLVDREAPRLTATVDVLVRDLFGRLGCWDAKCSFRPYGELRWYHRVQVHAQMATCSAEHGGILEGEGWSATFRDRAGAPIGPIVSRAIERDEGLIAELRAASREGWRRVEEARAAWRETQA